MGVNNITDELKNIKLTDPDAASKVKACFNKLNAINLPIMCINKGMLVYRATNITEGEVISSTKRLTYKPPDMNTSYQRASIPYETAFYGTYALFKNDFPIMEQCGMMMAFYEVCPLIRQRFIPNFITELVVSEWCLTQKVSFFALAATNGTNKSSYLNKVGSDFVQYLQRMGLNDKDITILNDFQNYMAERYTLNVDENNEYEYLISALFAEKIKNECQMEKEIDGLIWQSNLAFDDKLNDTLSFAMFPESADNKLEFLRCFKFEVQTDGNNIITIKNKKDITNSIKLQ